MLTLIIVNYYCESLVLDCITSINNSTIASKGKDYFEIIVVDNGSNSNVLKENQGDEFKLIINKENKGFGAACNLGFKLSKSKYILFLNPDTKVFKNTISNSIEFMESNQNVTVLGSQQLNENGEVLKTCTTKLTLKKYIIKSLYLNKIFPKRFKSHEMTYWKHLDSRLVDHVMGSFYMIKSEDFIKMNGFDEDYFVYYEDLDLSTRIIKNGGDICYNSDIKIYHETGGASKNFKPHRLFYSLDSMIYYGKKHFLKYEYYLLIVFILFVEPILRLGFALLKFNFKEMKQVVMAYRLLYLKRIF